MSDCLGCGNPTVETWYGSWCDSCGGVMARKDYRIFRHVLTVDGKAGRFALIFDESANDYAFIHPNKRNPRAGQPMDFDLGEFQVPVYLTTHGPLDAVLTIALAAAKGDPDDVPELSVAPSSTEEERTLLRI